MADEKTEDGKSEFTAEYVRELRQEREGHRLKAQETQTKLEKALADLKAAQTEATEVKGKFELADAARVKAESTALEAKTSSDARVITAELKSLAREQGLIDPDVLKLVDVSTLKINDKGEIEGLSDTVTKFKESKPHFFKEMGQTSSSSSTSSTSSTSSAPGASDGKGFDARVVAHGSPEYEAARRALIGVR